MLLYEMGYELLSYLLFKQQPKGKQTQRTMHAQHPPPGSADSLMVGVVHPTPVWPSTTREPPVMVQERVGG